MYQIVDEMFRLEGNGRYRSYGVLSSGGLRIGDITVDLAAMEGFVKKLNRFEASELHLTDLVLDFIG